jgi:hypothetical protein
MLPVRRFMLLHLTGVMTKLGGNEQGNGYSEVNQRAGNHTHPLQHSAVLYNSIFDRRPTGGRHCRFGIEDQGLNDDMGMKYLTERHLRKW